MIYTRSNILTLKGFVYKRFLSGAEQPDDASVLGDPMELVTYRIICPSNPTLEFPAHRPAFQSFDTAALRGIAAPVGAPCDIVVFPGIAQARFFNLTEQFKTRACSPSGAALAARSMNIPPSVLAALLEGSS